MSLSLDSIPQISKALVPWLVAQRKEIVEGGHYFDKEDNKTKHDGWGLNKAKDELRSAQSKLAAGKLSANMEAILRIVEGRAQNRIDYYEWRLVMVEKIVAAAK